MQLELALFYIFIIILVIAIQIAIIRWILRINEIVAHLSTISKLQQKTLAATQTIALTVEPNGERSKPPSTGSVLPLILLLCLLPNIALAQPLGLTMGMSIEEVKLKYTLEQKRETPHIYRINYPKLTKHDLTIPGLKIEKAFVHIEKENGLFCIRFVTESRITGMHGENIISDFKKYDLALTRKFHAPEPVSPQTVLLDKVVRNGQEMLSIIDGSHSYRRTYPTQDLIKQAFKTGKSVMPWNLSFVALNTVGSYNGDKSLEHYQKQYKESDLNDLEILGHILSSSFEGFLIIDYFFKNHKAAITNLIENGYFFY